jgi:hemerythrin-like domain-containing protein
MMVTVNKTRRLLAGAGAVIAASALLPAGAPRAAESAAAGTGKDEEGVGAPEDLMREHGVLRRILLIYDEISWRRIPAGEHFPVEVLAASAEVVRRFVEDYHEKLEEDHIFPRFRRVQQSVELVDTLLAQHRAGRVLTDAILDRANPGAMKDRVQRDKLAHALRLFAHMYRPHAAREDTVLFPSLRTIVSAHEFDALGEEFEDQEHQLFGEDGFEGVVAHVAALERQLGVYDLASFTASWPAS